MFKFKDILAIILGPAFFVWDLFLVIPFTSMKGGATGITLITYYLFKIPVSIMNLLINIPLFIPGLKLLGKKSLYLSHLGLFSVSAWMAILKPCPSATTTITLFLQPLKEIFCLPVLPPGVVLGLGLGSSSMPVELREEQTSSLDL